MSTIEFKSILKVFGGGKPTPEEQQQLFSEVLLMTLARATNADTNVHHVEVDTVQKVVKRETGEDIDTGSIRVAAASALFESTPLEKYLAKAGRSLKSENRIRIIRTLAEVIESDAHIRSVEADFFNMVAKAMKVTPAELAGLHPSD